MRPYVAWPSGFYIDERKITGYLLNVHGNSRGKAQWWLNQGYALTNPRTLMADLFDHTSAANFQGLSYSPWGHKLIFEGPILTPRKRMPRVRSVWKVAYGTQRGIEGVAELVTAHTI